MSVARNRHINLKMLPKILAQYELELSRSFHGMEHWERVYRIGVRLSNLTGADSAVVANFALLHDACRHDEGSDPHHGPRAALFAEKHRKLIKLDDDSFDVLVEAICGHTNGKTSEYITIGTCWDSDRLDIGRVGVIPDKRTLSTDEAKKDEFFKWATMLHEEKESYDE